MMSYAVTYDPQDLDNGIQLVFNADKTGEMRDSDRDTIWYDSTTVMHRPMPTSPIPTTRKLPSFT